MQCPTCGTNTPGTLGTCTNCNAPIQRLASPMGAPPQEPPPAQGLGDQTMVVPPLTPSWSSDPMSAPVASQEESRAEMGQGFNSVAPPPPPSWAAEAQPVDDRDGRDDDPIVPESWFARPRDPEQRPEEQATQMWQAQPPMTPDQGWGGGAQGQTMLDSAYANGGATQLDHPPMNVGPQPMGPMGPMGPMDPSLGQAMPMQGPMGGPMGPMGAGPGGPMGPMGPDGMPGGYYPPPPAPSNQASKPLLIAVTALVMIAVVAVALVVWPGGDDRPPVTASASPSPSDTPVAQKRPLSSPAKLQAIEVNKVLSSSANTRRILVRSIGATSKCQTLPTAIRGFQIVAQHRTAQIDQTNRLRFDRLRNGGRMQASLRQSFQASLEADQRLLAWANNARQGCKGRPRPDVAKAPGRIDAERRATLAKRQFVTLWNPVAKQAGLPPRAWNGL